MSIVYQYYRQGSTYNIAYSTSATNVNSLFNDAALNHLSVTATADCYVSVTISNGAITASATSSQFIMARTETIIPHIKAKSISVYGSAAGTLYVTEFLGA